MLFLTLFREGDVFCQRSDGARVESGCKSSVVGQNHDDYDLDYDCDDNGDEEVDNEDDGDNDDEEENEWRAQLSRKKLL